jgi:hypothetical protein
MPGLVLASLFFGAALGMRFKVFVLVPVLALCPFAIWAVTAGSAVSACFIAAALAFGGLQIGYLCGAVMRFYVPPGAPAKAAWPGRGSTPSPT